MGRNAPVACPARLALVVCRLSRLVACRESRQSNGTYPLGEKSVNKKQHFVRTQPALYSRLGEKSAAEKLMAVLGWLVYCHFQGLSGH